MYMDRNTLRRILDKSKEQAARRRDFYDHHDLKELRAMKFLAHQLYGDRGLLEAGPEEPGKIYLGYYIDPPGVPNQYRARQLTIFGNSLAELIEQAKLLGITGRIKA